MDDSLEEIIGGSHIDSCPVCLVANHLRMEEEDGDLHTSYHHSDNAINRVPDVFGLKQTVVGVGYFLIPVLGLSIYWANALPPISIPSPSLTFRFETRVHYIAQTVLILMVILLS